MIKHYCDSCMNLITPANRWRCNSKAALINTAGKVLAEVSIAVGTLPEDASFCIPCVKKQISSALDTELDAQNTDEEKSHD